MSSDHRSAAARLLAVRSTLDATVAELKGAADELRRQARRAHLDGREIDERSLFRLVGRADEVADMLRLYVDPTVTGISAAAVFCDVEAVDPDSGAVVRG